MDLLAAEATAELGGGDGGGDHRARRPVMTIAVNADSLATWFLPALAPLAGDLCFDLRGADQDRTSALLREGTVMAAVTAQARPVPGCTSTPLGAMRYHPLASPGFARRWFADGVSAASLARAPVVVFDRDDALQHRYLQRRARPDVDPPAHHVPASADFLTAVRLGLGWGMLPDLQAGDLLREGALVDLDPGGATDVPLHWQQWRLRSPTLDRLTAAVHDAARGRLQPVR